MLLHKAQVLKEHMKPLVASDYEVDAGNYQDSLLPYLRNYFISVNFDHYNILVGIEFGTKSIFHNFLQPFTVPRTALPRG